jgi:hypothetical protein
MAELRAVELRTFGARPRHSGSMYLSHRSAGSRRCMSESRILKPFFIKRFPHNFFRKFYRNPLRSITISRRPVNTRPPRMKASRAMTQKLAGRVTFKTLLQ